jgi:hypothetical protein
MYLLQTPMPSCSNKLTLSTRLQMLITVFPGSARTFGNSYKALNILQMAWKIQREEGRLVECATCIQRLGTCVLLA